MKETLCFGFGIGDPPESQNVFVPSDKNPVDTHVSTY